MVDGLECFDGLPEKLFQGLRDQMLLGMLPSRVVEELLDPCLREYEALWPQISPALVNDLEDILRIYPEIAAKHGLAPGPSLAALLDVLWERLRCGMQREGEPCGPAVDEGARELEQDMAAEGQRPLLVEKKHPRMAGRAHLTTDRGTGVLIAFAYNAKTGCLHLRGTDLPCAVQLVICGRIILTLDAGDAEGLLCVDGLKAFFGAGRLPALEWEFREAASTG